MSRSIENFRCLACNEEEGELILDLGDQPLANSLLQDVHSFENERRFPLRLALCKGCWLLQITDLVPPEELFSDYVYFSSFSDRMLEHAAQASESYCERFGLNERNFVVEIASNDGYLLKNFVRKGIPCLGIEPAENIASVARENGVETQIDFFGKECATGLVQKGKKADLIIGNNVFAHVPDINDFVAGLNILLSDNGTAVLEFPYGKELIEKGEFDTIYHEHVFYFTLMPLLPLLKRHGLEIYDAEELSIHGGSLRIFVGHHGYRKREPGFEKLLQKEEMEGLNTVSFYIALKKKAEALKEGILQLLLELRKDGRRIAAYGAAAKGSTLLNFCGISHDFVEFIVDKSCYKQGKFSPGLHLPIRPVGDLKLLLPDYTIILAWNFADEIIEQQQEYLEAGGRFIVPLPELNVNVRK